MPAEVSRIKLFPRTPPYSPACVAEMVGGGRCERYSGTDLAALVREAGVRALRRALGTLREMDEGPTGPREALRAWSC